jgi:hypothetical protein
VQIRVIKSSADAPLTSLQSAAAIAAQTFGFQLIPATTAANFEDHVEDAGGTPKRETCWVFDDAKTADIQGQSWTLERFLKSFMDREWCDQNADHPVANLRHYSENVAKYREHFRTHKPMVLIRRGQRVLKLRADATDEEKAKWLKLL